jgi:hypothetical protein
MSTEISLLQNRKGTISQNYYSPLKKCCRRQEAEQIITNQQLQLTKETSSKTLKA